MRKIAYVGRIFVFLFFCSVAVMPSVFASERDGLAMGAYCKYDNIDKWRFGFDEAHRFGRFISDFNIGVNSGFGKFNISYALGAVILDGSVLGLGAMAGADFNASFKDIKNNMDVSVKAEAVGTLHVSSHLDLNLRGALGCNFDIAGNKKSFMYGGQVSITYLLFTRSPASAGQNQVEPVKEEQHQAEIQSDS